LAPSPGGRMNSLGLNSVILIVVDTVDEII